MSKINDLFRFEDTKITFDSIDLEKDLAQKFGTPTYVFSGRKIKENIMELESAFKTHYQKSTIAYSTKNNMLPEIISLISEKVNFFETTSLLELKIIEKIAKIKNKSLSLISTNLYKPDGLIQEILSFDEKTNTKKDSSNGLIAIDSYQDLKNIERVAKKTGQKAKVLIRINPGIKMSRVSTIFASAYPDAKCSTIISDIDAIKNASDNEKISDWLLPRKIIPEFDNAERLLQEAHTSKHLQLLGIHGHLGSQVTNMDYFDHFFEVITIFYKLMEEKLGLNFQYLDLGGGYPVKYSENDSYISIEAIAKNLASKISKAKIKPELIIESGRFITASSAILLAKVNITKQNPSGGNIAVLDLSVYSDLLDIIAAKWHYDCLLTNNLPIDKTSKKEWELVGATNDTLDQLAPIKTEFVRDLIPGDLIAIKNAGAYTTCFNSNYCGKPKPLVVLLDDKNPHIIKLLKRV